VSAAGEAVVSVTGVTRRYSRVTALDDVNLDLAPHTIHGLLGRNGAGKTTLLQILVAQRFASSGQVRLFGV
jgi:ABC-2 type transport system ATP-binding protein